MAEATDKSTRQSPFDTLPFFAGRPRAGQKAGLSPRHFWTVKPTGDFGIDCNVGQEYALLYLAAEEVEDSGSLLPSIVADMPREPEFGGIEVGFLQLVGFAARAGAGRARQIAAHWKRSMAELEAQEKLDRAMRPTPTARKRKTTKKP